MSSISKPEKQIVLHLIPTLEGGGAERQLVMLAKEQARQGWKVHVGLRRGGVHEKKLRDSSVKVHYLGDLKGLHPLLILRILQLIQTANVDVMQTWLPQMDLIGGVVVRLARKPWLISERSSRGCYLDNFRSNLRLFLAARASGVVANSREGANYWAEECSHNLRVWVIPNAVPIQEIRESIGFSLRDMTGDKKVLLMVGSLLAYKGHNIFIGAIKKVIERFDVHGLIVGDGPLHSELIQSIQNYGLEKHISLIPFKNDWWGLLKTSTALISCSTVEGQPNVVLEAMAAECPLIVSDIASHKEILDDQSALFVNVGKIDSLADTIVDLLLDEDSAPNRAKKAYLKVSDLTSEAAANAYSQVYREIIRDRDC